MYFDIRNAFRIFSAALIANNDQMEARLTLACQFQRPPLVREPASRLQHSRG